MTSLDLLVCKALLNDFQIFVFLENISQSYHERTVRDPANPSINAFKPRPEQRSQERLQRENPLYRQRKVL